MGGGSRSRGTGARRSRREQTLARPVARQGGGPTRLRSRQGSHGPRGEEESGRSRKEVGRRARAVHLRPRSPTGHHLAVLGGALHLPNLPPGEAGRLQANERWPVLVVCAEQKKIVGQRDQRQVRDTWIEGVIYDHLLASTLDPPGWSRAICGMPLYRPALLSEPREGRACPECTALMEAADRLQERKEDEQ